MSSAIIDPNRPFDPEDPQQPAPKPTLPPWRTFMVKYSDNRKDETVVCHAYGVEGTFVRFDEYAYFDAEQTKIGCYTRRSLANVIDVTEIAIVRPGAKEN